jgi:hypothetical protein
MQIKLAAKVQSIAMWNKISQYNFQFLCYKAFVIIRCPIFYMAYIFTFAL